VYGPIRTNAEGVYRASGPRASFRLHFRAKGWREAKLDVPSDASGLPAVTLAR
jgi:hypothetical protein